jgi:mannonate dehydratase
MPLDTTSKIKLAREIPWDASDDDLLFLKQLGLRWVRLELNEDLLDADQLIAVKNRLAEYGLGVFSIRQTLYRSLRIQLGQDGRDEDIESYRRMIRAFGKAEIPVTLIDFHPGNTYTTSHVERRGYTARVFDLDTFRNAVEEQRYDRVYTADDMWANYTYFIDAVLPVAEESGVILALHPDDPPLDMMNGVAKLFTHIDGYRRAEEISRGSESWGIRFCVGTWSEGGDQMGADVFEVIEDFGGRGKLFEVDFRNVSSPLPRFEETFQDDGYMDMAQVMNTLRKVNFTGAVVPDHIPMMVGDDGIRRAGTAYTIAYMKALIQRADEEISGF